MLIAIKISCAYFTHLVMNWHQKNEKIIKSQINKHPSKRKKLHPFSLINLLTQTHHHD